MQNNKDTLLIRVVYLLDVALTTIYESIQFSVRDVMLFPGRNLRSAFSFSILITVIALTSKLLGLITFINWIGGLCAAVFLFIVSYLTGGDIHELPRTNDSNGTIGQDGDNYISVEENEVQFEGASTYNSDTSGEGISE